MTSNDCSCSEYSSSRRSFIRNALAVTGGAVATMAFGETFRQTAYGATNGNVLVVLSLRGGADGLSIVVPHGDPDYYPSRPRIAIPKASLLVPDGLFGLHPGLQPLQGMWTGGKMSAIHATGLPQPNRSHFSAVEEIEDADLGSQLRSGWINRLIGLDTDTSPLQGVTIGSGLLPTSMYGPESTLATNRTEDIQLFGAQDDAGQLRRRQALTQLWQSADGPLGVGARSSLATTATLGPALAKRYVPANGATYPASDLGDALKDTARLVKAQVGVEVVTLDYGSWDMHSALGTLGSTGDASMQGMVSNMGKALAAFFADLGVIGDRVTLVTLTEFGRRVVENGAAGLDHGWGNATLLMGAGVKGGRYYGTWPGLNLSSTADGDVSVTTDYRSILAEVLSSRFGASIPTVFPNFRPESLGLMA
ncbi:MAG: DUF1501 domain-containing protein [Actinomycetota bacterium]|jgi:uncharacterized protein (DUF1501 family)|nr:DUF1501 domain-containing protein [Actinomycetota bacterium]MDQ3424152.1 DUF1501 domain-containing protein [Actinomycetota bacterium]